MKILKFFFVIGLLGICLSCTSRLSPSQEAEDNEATILQSLLQPGVYFVKTIYKDGNMSTYKFMK
jgi:hypothetical protein